MFRLQKWQRMLADPKIPVRVPGPFDIQIVAEIEGRPYILSLQFIDDGPVVNPVDRRLSIVQPIPSLYNIRDCNCFNAAQLLRQHDRFRDQEVPPEDSRRHLWAGK